MSITPTSASAAPNSSGCWVMRRADEQPAIRAAADGDALRPGPAGRRQPPEAGGEIVEDVLLVREPAGVVPRLAVLPSAAQRGDREQAAALHPGEPLGLEHRPDRDVEAAVAVEERRDVAVGLDVAAAGEEQRDAGAVVRCHEDLLGDEVVRVPGSARDRTGRTDPSAIRTARTMGGETNVAKVRNSSSSRAGRRSRRSSRCRAADIVGTWRPSSSKIASRLWASWRYTAASRSPTTRTCSSASSASGRSPRWRPGRRRPWRSRGRAARRGPSRGRSSGRWSRCGRSARRPRRARADDRGLDAAVEIGDVDPALGIRSPPDRDDEEPPSSRPRARSPTRALRAREDEAVVGGSRPEAVVAQLHVEVRRVVGGVGAAAPGSGRRRSRRRRAVQAADANLLHSIRSGRSSPVATLRTASVRQSEPAWLRAQATCSPLSDTATDESAVVPSPLSSFGSTGPGPPPSGASPSRGRPGPGGRCCGAGTSGRRGATERRRAGSPIARSAGRGSRSSRVPRRGPRGQLVLGLDPRSRRGCVASSSGR